MPRSPRRSLDLALICTLMSVLPAPVCPQTTPSTVHCHPDYDFLPSILAEHESLDAFLELYADSLATPRSQSRYGLALTSLTLGLLQRDPYPIVMARALFAAHAELAKDPREVEFSRLGAAYADAILSGNYYRGTTATEGPDPVVIVRIPAPTDFRSILLGRSAIRVTKDTRIKTQVDRVTRDWLTGVNVTSAPGILSRPDLVPFHEGQKVAELIALTAATVTPVFGTRVRRFDEDWYAPDAAGVYRFALSEDKVINYPTTLIIDDYNALLNDTHGISAIAWDCLDADLAIGCGDHPGKIEAAYYLADQGVDVYVPTDRFLSLLIGTRTKGTIIGSAPIRKTPTGAVIGDQTIAIDIHEPIVVSTAQGRYPLQYYDTPWCYFSALKNYCGKDIQIIPVAVTEYGKATNVIDRARELKVQLIGMRVKSRVEHDAVAGWLQEDRAHRAVLFHTAVYPDGYRLFREFPAQTSFGDVNPVFE